MIKVILAFSMQLIFNLAFFISDYKTGFGGQYGVQSDRVDKSAVGWEHHEALQKHESQKDYSKGFGGKFGVQTDRKDKTALSYDDQSAEKIGTNYVKTKPDIPARNAGNLKARFENMAKQNEEESKVRIAITTRNFSVTNYTPINDYKIFSSTKMALIVMTKVGNTDQLDLMKNHSFLLAHRTFLVTRHLLRGMHIW